MRGMDKTPEAPKPRGGAISREDRLAAKLRENLKRRKTQARTLSDDSQKDAADD